MAVGSLLVIVIVFLSSAWANKETYSYSLAVGHGSGDSYQSKAEGVEGLVTAIRLWEHNNAYISGLQFQYDGIWSALVGQVSGTTIEMELHTGEFITQISGKWNSGNYIYQLYFVTNRGRMLTAGQPTDYSFNFYPVHPDARLVLVSGRFTGAGITSIGAHWDVVY